MVATTKQWAQDQLVKPVRASTAKENAVLYKYRRDQYNYVFDVIIPNGVSTLQNYIFNAPVDVSSDFWITQFVFTIGNYTTLSDINSGYVTVTDNTNQYNIVQNMWLGAFGQTNNVYANLNQNYAQRAIWPEPYGIGAGSSFTVTINNLNAGFYGSVYPINAQFYVEGFKNYRLGPNNAGQ